MSLEGRRIVLGVSGGIAAYKAPDLVRRLRDAGASVRVVMTRGAESFVSPMTFQAVSGHPVHDTLWSAEAEAAMGHIDLARWADLVLVAPATANVMARLAHGLADDLLTTLILATESPVCIAPAMNHQMWLHPATQGNLTVLEDRGVAIMGPGAGDQACGETGPGRMLEPQDLADRVQLLLGRAGTLAGVKVLVTAGPTLEDLDPVRFLGNRSSGKMGFAVAEAARRLGAEVTLVAGPVSLDTPARVERVNVRSAQEMYAAVMQRAADSDIYVGAAAVADFRPKLASEEKIKKGTEDFQTIELVRNPDILAAVAGSENAPFTVGFAAETSDVEQYARGKLDKKKIDMIAANRVGVDHQGFDCGDNALTVLWNEGRQDLALQPKSSLAGALMQLVEERFRTARDE